MCPCLLQNTCSLQILEPRTVFPQSHFHDRIAQLVYTFPEDAVTSTGSLFWSPPKRFPHPLHFSASDPGHAAFVQAGAILKAEVHSIAQSDWACNAGQVGKRLLLHHSIPDYDLKWYASESLTIVSTGGICCSSGASGIIRASKGISNRDRSQGYAGECSRSG